VKTGPLVVIGDTLLDVDIDGTADRLSPDAPVPVIDCRQEHHRAGGAGLAATLAACTHPDVVLITALSDDRHGSHLCDLLHPHMKVLSVPLIGGTPCKTRVRASGQAVVRLDTGNGRAGNSPIDEPITATLNEAGAVLVSDYGRGVAANPALRAALDRLPSSVPIVWDPHPRGAPPVAGTRLVTPNQAEARAFAAAFDVAAHHQPLVQSAHDAAALVSGWRAAGVAVTLGAGGALVSVGDAAPFMVPAPPLDPLSARDTCGAGDRFAVTATQVLYRDGLLEEAVSTAVRDATEFVAAGGAPTVPGLSVPDAGTTAVQDRSSSLRSADRERDDEIRLIATGGCFDLLHAGHIGLLRAARRLGDRLVVCLNSDASVRTLKGPGRPLVPAEDRAQVLSALEYVDDVIIFDEPTPAAVLERLRPDIWVKGGDYGGAELAEAEVVRRHGGEVVLLPYASGHSTSRIVAAARTMPERSENSDLSERRT
jgi:D-beta-D-heptose 7-phosphate kinase / D-beta-D-heptose 1-phosphate adenosyltransferase